MFSGFLVLSALVVLGQSMAVENLDMQQRWTVYKKEHNKAYAPSEEAKRLALFEESVKIVEEHNKRYEQGLESYFMAINQFSDMTKEEFKSYTLGRYYSLEELKANFTGAIRKPSSVAAPASIDWRNQGVVTGVKNQGACGSCWAFSTTGALESAMKIQKGVGPTPLSEQQLVDCNDSNYGCSGGWMSAAYDYIKECGGIESESDYPAYSANEQQCRFDINKIAVQISGRVNIDTNEGALEEACGNQGPIAIAIEVTDNFQRYGGGVFVDNACTGPVNHAVLAVGYDSEGGNDYWIVKNSWGGQWGESGYIRMGRNRNNMCSIASYGVYPIVYWA